MRSAKLDRWLLERIEAESQVIQQLQLKAPSAPITAALHRERRSVYAEVRRQLPGWRRRG